MKKATRQTRAKQIAKVGPFEKLDVALGGAAFRTYFETDVHVYSDTNAHAFISNVKRFHAKIPSRPLQSRDNAAEFMDIGIRVSTAIAAGDYKFFARLAAILQHKAKPPEPDKYYADIIRFCLNEKCGFTESQTENFFPNARKEFTRPCDPGALLDYLKKCGWYFEEDGNRIPRTLRAVCKKLGIVLRKR